MNQTTKMPKPIRIQRKLEVASERIVVLGDDDQARVVCTRRATGCPIHTC